MLTNDWWRLRRRVSGVLSGRAREVAADDEDGSLIIYHRSEN